MTSKRMFSLSSLLHFLILPVAVVDVPDVFLALATTFALAGDWILGFTSGVNSLGVELAEVLLVYSSSAEAEADEEEGKGPT